jgi:signal peptidase II
VTGSAESTGNPSAPVDSPDTPATVTAVGGRARAVTTMILTSLVVLTADILVKVWMVASMEDHAPVRLLGGAVYLVVTRNSGAAFSIGTQHTYLFPLITLAVLTWISFMALRLRSMPWAVALGLVMGGALGNFIDRIFRAPGFFVGEVVDYLALFAPSSRWFPIFNLADSALSVGVVLALILVLTNRHHDGTRHQHSDQ